MRPYRDGGGRERAWLAAGLLAVLAAAAMAFAAGPGPERDPAKPIVIGHREKEGKTGSRDFGPIREHLNAGGKYRFEFRAFDSADELYEAFRSGNVEAALLGPVYYVRAHSELGAYPIVSEGASYHSVIVVRKESPIRKLEELKGKRFALGYKDSTSSHYYPLLMLSKARLKESDLAAADFVGSHGKVVEAVLGGKYDAGGLIESEYERSHGLRVLARSDAIPGVPVAVRKELDPRVADDLKAKFLSWHPATPDPEKAFSGGAVGVDDKAYNQIRFLCKVLFGKDYK